MFVKLTYLKPKSGGFKILFQRALREIKIKDKGNGYNRILKDQPDHIGYHKVIRDDEILFVADNKNISISITFNDIYIIICIAGQENTDTYKNMSPAFRDVLIYCSGLINVTKRAENNSRDPLCIKIMNGLMVIPKVVKGIK